MDSKLKDFRPDNPDFIEDEELLQKTDSEIPASAYHQEINTLKIDKLSNRVTIISIILPCLIGAIIVFSYLDIKERMVDVDLTKQNQVERIFQQLTEKLNALDVKIAKNKFEFENKLPELDKKNSLLEGQIAKLTTTKADAKAIKNQFTKLEKRVGNNTNQDTATVQIIERINRKTLSSIKKNQDQFNKAAGQIKEDITLFKEEFDARLLELSDYEQQIGELRKNVSILDKKLKGFEKETVSNEVIDGSIRQLKEELSTHMKTLDQQVKKLSQRLTTNLSRLQNDLDQLSKTSSSAIKSADTKPKPKINIDSSEPVTIEEESLKE